MSTIDPLVPPYPDPYVKPLKPWQKVVWWICIWVLLVCFWGGLGWGAVHAVHHFFK